MTPKHQDCTISPWKLHSSSGRSWSKPEETEAQKSDSAEQKSPSEAPENFAMRNAPSPEGVMWYWY